MFSLVIVRMAPATRSFWARYGALLGVKQAHEFILEVEACSLEYAIDSTRRFEEFDYEWHVDDAFNEVLGDVLRGNGEWVRFRKYEGFSPYFAQAERRLRMARVIARGRRATRCRARRLANRRFLRARAYIMGIHGGHEGDDVVDFLSPHFVMQRGDIVW
jgi:hypothetical protein